MKIKPNESRSAGANQAAPSAQSFINAALGQGASQSSTNQSGITQDMLTQALQSVQATMQATGQSPAQLDGANQGLAQAAQGVVSGSEILIFLGRFLWV